MVPAVVLGAVLLVLLVGLGVFYRYTHTEAWRHGDLRRATFELLVVIGPFFGVRVKPPEPEPSAVMTPKGDAGDDPLSGRLSFGEPDEKDRPTS